METPTVLVKNITSSIVKITLNRPKALNALNVDLLSNLCSALRENATAQVIILEGSGDRSFCAGEDLKQTLAPKTGSGEELRLAFERLQDLTRLTSSSSTIVIAAVQGFAIGGGAEIALAADFVIGGPQTKFKFPEASIGHAVTGGISLRLVPMVGLLRAKELFLTGRFVGAEEALRIGLLTEITEDPKLRALELAHETAGRPKIAMSMSKAALERAVFPNMESILADEVNVASYCFSQSDAEKAFSNFASRKAPPTAASFAKDLNTALSNAISNDHDSIFLRFGKVDLTFSNFDSLVSKLAGGFQNLGIQSGDKVLVMMRNSVEMVTTWFAANRLGAVWVPINSELKSITLKHVVEAAEAKIAIVDEEFYAEIQGTAQFDENKIFTKGTSQAYPLSALSETGNEVNTYVKVLPSTVSAYLYTSGTTGRSKPCILTHKYFTNQASVLINSFSITSSDVLYCPFPLFHADATALTVVPALLTGCTAALAPRFSTSRFWDEIRSTRATIYDFMGATLTLIYKQPPLPTDTDHNVRLAWGVPVPSWAFEYETRFGHRVKELYGSVEAGLPIVQLGDRIPGSCGKVLPGYNIRVADDYDNPLPPNTPGNLLVRTDIPHAFFSGYFNSPEQTLSTTQNGWLHTGDLARVDDAGNVFFLGRTKDIIRRKGENVNAFEIEEEMLRHEDIVSVAAFAVPSLLGDGDGTEDEVKVAVVRREGSGLAEKQLWEWARRNMARFQWPDCVEIVEGLERTETGKVRKGALGAEGGVWFDRRETKGNGRCGM
ncbi:putative coenzyme A synthetase [Cadophora sp. DSE1049]|nr:putative coenzyme A synthetase [Cadophora sp. DSE1049]